VVVSCRIVKSAVDGPKAAAIRRISCYIPAAFNRISLAVFFHALPSEVVLSPILVRPVREQLEHDRVIRLLQAKYKRKFEVAINPGNEQTMPVGNGPSPWYPDLVLQSTERGRKLLGVVEVETTESVNNLEAMSQWAALSKQRAPFHLYVPTSSIDTARRLCADLGIPVAELWAYQAIGDQIRFTLVQRTQGSEPQPRSRPVEAPTRAPAPTERAPANGRAAAAPRPSTAPRARPARRPVTPAATRRKPAPKAKATARRATAAKPPARKTASRTSKRR